MNPITDPINNLRRHLFAFTCDIESFFHNVKVDERDRGCFRFFWYADESMTVLRTFIFLMHIFGSSLSPSVTSYVLKELESNSGKKYTW